MHYFHFPTGCWLLWRRKRRRKISFIVCLFVCLFVFFFVLLTRHFLSPLLHFVLGLMASFVTLSFSLYLYFFCFSLSLDSFKCESLLFARYYLLNLCNMSLSFSPISILVNIKGVLLSESTTKDKSSFLFSLFIFTAMLNIRTCLH